MTGLTSFTRAACFSPGESGEVISNCCIARKCPKYFSGKVKRIRKRRLGGHPEQPLALAHGLPFANVAPRNQPIKRCGDFRFFQLEFQRAFLVVRGIQRFLDAFDIPLVGLRLVLCVLQLFLGDQAQIPEPLGADIIRLQYARLRLPILQIVRDAARLGARCLQIRGNLPVIQLSQHGSRLHSRRRVKIDFGEYAIPLRRQVHLVLDDDGSRDDESRIRRFHRAAPFL